MSTRPDETLHLNSFIMNFGIHRGEFSLGWGRVVGLPTKPSQNQNPYICRGVTVRWLYLLNHIKLYNNIVYYIQEEQSNRLRLLPLVSSAIGVAGVVANKLVDGVRLMTV